VARIDYPANRSLLSGAVSVGIEVRSSVPGTWTLWDEQESGSLVQLAVGSGNVTDGQPVFSGVLAPGPHRLVLESQSVLETLSDDCKLAVCAPALAGWPYESNLATIPYDQDLMAETTGHDLLVIRPVESGRQGVSAGQLLWLDGSGQALPGWPVDLSSLLQSISPYSDPLPVRRSGGEHMLLVSKTSLLELDHAGILLAQVPVNGLVLGEPVLLPVPGAGMHTLLWVQLQDQVHVCRYDAGLNLVSSTPLEGFPAWPRPLLGDFSGDGKLDLILPMRVNGSLRLQLLNLESGSLTLLHQLLDPGLAGIQVGDLGGEGQPEVVLAGKQGLVLALDSDGVRWSRVFSGAALGALSLADAGDDGRQEISLLARDAAGVRFLNLDDQGQETSASGVIVSPTGEAEIAPLLVRGGPEGSRYLVTVQPREPESWAARFLWVSLAGELQVEDWLLPTMSSGPPRLVDLDSDGTVELLAGDSYGRWMAWPTRCRDSRPTHPLGDARHGGLSVQPVALGCQPGLLSGAVSLPANYVLPCGTDVRELEVVSGCLTVREPWGPQSLRVGPRAELRLEPGTVWNGTEPVPLQVEGRLHVLGAAADLQAELRTESPSNHILAGMELELLAGSHLTLESCRLHELARGIHVSAGCTLDVESSWLLAGSHGFQVDGGVLEVRNSLLQPGFDGLHLSAGARGVIRGSVITAAASAVALDCSASRLELQDCTVLTCQDALRFSDASQAVLDSVHFQGNGRDVVLEGAPGLLTLSNCDFVESHLVGLDNNSSLAATTTGCFWDLQTPCEGVVQRVDDSLQPVKPLVIPRPVFRVDTGPMVDGDEPIEWEPVEFSVGGIPIKVEYRVYRSTHPYDVIRPENLVLVTPLTAWRDPLHLPACYYCVTASMGKPTLD
jgi:hypothetical protein